MLFNSYVFLLAFLPLALVGFFSIARFNPAAARLWLIAGSFLFYGWWNPAFCLFLAVSIAWNYGVSRLIGMTERTPRRQTLILCAGIAANLAVLCYFKYLMWFAGLINAAFGARLDTGFITLPLGISFFTFTQIGYLVDCHAGVATNRRPMNYVLFVTFFPHLIAGPILHNQEIMPQFEEPATFRWSSTNMMVGAGIFIVGLLKKTLLADPASTGIATAFAHPDTLPLFAAWQTALSYSLQLYFDFSGYSDMAIGLARMFNVTFPMNFDSPYKAASVIDYWQRWHMTLTRYLTRYVYTPIAVAAMRARRARNLPINRAAQQTLAGFSHMIAWPIIATMTLAGIWHGSGTQFLVFGVLHGIYLSVNHAWRLINGGPSPSSPFRIVHIALTYLCVLVGAVFFRAPSVAAAISMLAGMVGLHGLGGGLPIPVGLLDPKQLPPLLSDLSSIGLVRFDAAWSEAATTLGILAWFAALYGIVWLLPNTQQIFARYAPTIEPVRPGALFQFSVAVPWAIVLGCGAALAVLSLGGSSEFIYFQF